MHILYICSGNLSRSPLAECITRQMLSEAGETDITVSSAGTYDLQGEPYDPKMAEVAARHGYHLSGHAQQMTDEMLRNADYIIVMEDCHYVKVQKELPYSRWDRLFLMNKIAWRETTGIDDPLGGSDAQYERIFSQIEACCSRIIQDIIFTRHIKEEQKDAKDPLPGHPF
ncbi:MAG: low molecular weight phosphotyrosine protein phosphatase [Paludibacteraceae bacterium]|nr:low molecular weight phosphotyrosine protein phosphatase [Paludibacteraceae bacterium]